MFSKHNKSFNVNLKKKKNRDINSNYRRLVIMIFDIKTAFLVYNIDY